VARERSRPSGNPASPFAKKIYDLVFCPRRRSLHSTACEDKRSSATKNGGHTVNIPSTASRVYEDHVQGPDFNTAARTAQRIFEQIKLSHSFLCTGLALAFVASSMMTTPVNAVSASPAGFYVSQIPLAGTSCPQTGDFTPSDGSQGQVEFAGQGVAEDGSPGPAPGTVVNRSLSKGPALNPSKKREKRYNRHAVALRTQRDVKQGP
jgi:hypothetical protein